MEVQAPLFEDEPGRESEKKKRSRMARHSSAQRPTSPGSEAVPELRQKARSAARATTTSVDRNDRRVRALDRNLELLLGGPDTSSRHRQRRREPAASGHEPGKSAPKQGKGTAPDAGWALRLRTLRACLEVAREPRLRRAILAEAERILAAVPHLRT